MSFALRRAATRLHLRRTWSPKRLSSTSNSDVALDTIPPTFIQTPPLWVRFAWPLIIGNALLLASAIDITWNHWSTLIKDLEAVAERNRQNAATTAEAKRKIDKPPLSPSSAPAVEDQTNMDQNDSLTTEPAPSTSSTVDTSKKEESTYIWERRPTWQRAGFCGIYVMGWAFSTAYLLKYRQTYVTRVKFFRGPSSPKPLSPPTPVPASSPKTVPSPNPPPSPTKSTSGSTAIIAPTEGTLENRFIHIQTASTPKGITIPLKKLSLYEGRNETELVIRSNLANSARSRWNRTGREYWFMSLSGAVIDGTRFGKVESARDKIVKAWFGHDDDVKQRKKKKKGKKGSSP